MGAEANRAEQNPTATESEQVEELLEAARYNDIDDVMKLAADGVSLDSKDAEGRTALHMASANGNVDIVNYLISNKVDINASNVENNTPLHWACLNGHIEISDFSTTSYKSEVKPDFRLQHLLKNEHRLKVIKGPDLLVVKTLILAGAEVSSLNRHERTPVDEAAIGGRMDVIDAISTTVAQLELTRASV